MNETLGAGLTQALAFLALGGPVVALLVAISVVSLAIVILKYWQFFRAGVGRHRLLRQALDAWTAGDREAAAKRLRNDGAVASQLTWQAMMAVAQSTPPGKPSDRPVIEDRVAAEAGGRVTQLRRGFRALEAIAQIAPLLGLFGTVLGMIEAFRQLQAAGNTVDPAVLAGGIWVALLTTAVGLAVAMPTSLILTHLESRVAREVTAIEYALTSVLNPVRLVPSPPASPNVAGSGRAAGSLQGMPSNAA